MIAVLRFVFSVIGVLWLAFVGAYVVYWYDRRPPDVPTYTLHIGPFSHVFGLPESLSAQLTTIKTAEAAVAKHTAIVVARQAQISAQASANEARTISVIHTRTITLMKEVPVVLGPEVDHSFPLPDGLVRLYDASAIGVDLSAIPNAAGESDDSPSPVTASQAGTVFVANNGECLADRAQLLGLIGWNKAVQAAAH